MSYRRKRQVIPQALILVLFLTSWLFGQPLYDPKIQLEKLPLGLKGPVKNIIFFIGDGMSVATVSAARYRAASTSGKLHMDRMPVAGFVRTCSADKLITDSAAAATAMSSGFKTNNGVIGQTPAGEKVKTILEVCQTLGKSTGLIATSSITHATPAGFAAHVASRKMETVIAEQLIQKKINVLFGGGRAFFIPKSQNGSKREDERNLLQEAQSFGYQVCVKKEEMQTATSPQVLGLFAEVGLTTVAPEPSLADMTDKAISLLQKNKKGFFLMVEGSQIDWVNGQGDAEASAKQTLDLDQAVSSALAFAEKDGKTLVVVTADHETGGLIIAGGAKDGSQLEVVWGLKKHNGATVPLVAYGPGAESFSGFEENSDIPVAMARLLKVKDFPQLVK